MNVCVRVFMCVYASVFEILSVEAHGSKNLKVAQMSNFAAL